MKYPKLSKKLDRRCKLTLSDIRNIRFLKKTKRYTLSDLSKKFCVHFLTIKYWTNSKFRKLVKERGRNQKRIMDIERRKEIARESARYVRGINPLLKKYQQYRYNLIKKYKKKIK